MDGIINVYKEAGYTSFDVVAKLRGILKQRKIGHTGTLDPDAEGVLLVCVGKATKLCEYLTKKDKVYQATLHLGITTDTQDGSGNVLEEHPVTLSEEQLEKTIHSFVGKIRQVPPMYSALKVNGKKLCDLARKGVEVERKAREIEIFSIEICEIELPRVTMLIHCSKGAYIRTLCDDIGKKAGCGGYMEKLVRTETAGVSLSDACRLHEIEEIVKGTDKKGRKLSDILKPVDWALIDYKEVTARKGMEKQLWNGGRIPLSQTGFREGRPGELYRMYDASGTFVGLFSYDAPQKEFRPEKIFLIGNCETSYL